MVEYLSGKVIELAPTDIVVEVGGVGYKLIISLSSYEAFNEKESVKVYVEEYYLRDAAPVSYGFASKEERELFRLLTSVSGVGGNSARTILSTYNSSELQTIIATGDSAMLKRVKGLGQKTSEKVIVELRDKIANIESGEIGNSLIGDSSSNNVGKEALQALTLLGFKRDLSQKSVRAILAQEPNLTVEEVIKRALKTM